MCFFALLYPARPSNDSAYYTFMILVVSESLLQALTKKKWNKLQVNGQVHDLTLNISYLSNESFFISLIHFTKSLHDTHYKTCIIYKNLPDHFFCK